MYVSGRQRCLALFVVFLMSAFSAVADDVTVSGVVNFSALDGSSLDHDGSANGTFSVTDGSLSVLGVINCNDVSGTNACAMNFAVSGDFVMAPGSALYAENRSGGGRGGDVSLTIGGDLILAAATATQPGAIISTSNHDSASGSAGGNLTAAVAGSASLGVGSIVSAGAKGGAGGAVAITAGGHVSLDGLVASGPSSSQAATAYTGAILSGGSSTPSGGDVTIRSTSHAEPAITVSASAVVVSQSGSGASGTVALEGCGLVIQGLVASVSVSGPAAKVVLRSGTSILLDGRDLNGIGTRKGMLRADALQQSAASYSANLYAREGISVLGPGPGALFAVTSNGGATSKDASGSINLIATAGTVTASGNTFAATNSDAGDQGGFVNVSASGNINLDTAKIDAAGDDDTGNNDRAGGSIDVRSYSGGVSWQNGSGDVRPTGTASGVALAKQGTIRISYCTTYDASGTSFFANGTPNAPWPNVTQSCSPAAPALPLGEAHPDCNDPALAVDDAYTVAEGGTLNVSAPGILANDVDPDGDPLTAALVSGPVNAASFTLNADGSFSYVHNGGETSSDSFTYVANDGSVNSNTATVIITVTPVNDAPVANDDEYGVAEGGTLNYATPGVLANDTDSDGPAMAAALVTGPAHAASFTLNADGSFIYVHDGSETTSDSFTYKANDGALDSNVASASITISPVNDAPVANGDSGSVNEGGTLAGASVLGNDTDAENDTLTAVLVSGPANASSFTLNANGTYSYVHDGSETSADSFSYKANDGAADSNVATVSINVQAVNDAPVATGDSGTVAEGGTLTVVAPGVLGNDTDAENEALSAVLVSGPSHAASFTLNASGSFTYQHDGSETTSDSFTYKANDGSADSNVVTVSLTVIPVNDAPVATADTYALDEAGTLTVGAPGVLGNDTDAENETLAAVVVSGPTHASSFTLNADGSFTYVHDGSETSSDSFTYKANDGAADSSAVTVSISINPVNDAPVAQNDAYAVNEGGTLTVPAPGVLGNDTDVDGNTTAVLVSGPANATSFALNADGSFTYVHNGSETASDSFTYKANDGAADSNIVTVTITINAVNDAPVAAGDSYGTSEGGTLNIPAPGVLGNDTDAENQSLAAVLVSGPANAASFAFNADGSFSYVHNGGETTSDSFTYKANDGTSDSNTVTVTISITPVNDPPVANADSYSVTFGGSLTVSAPGVLGNDADPENDGLTASLVSGPSAGNLTLNADGSFSYTHTGSSLGTDSFTYVANDGAGNSNVATVTINIINQPPVASNDSFSGVGNTQLRVGTGGAAHPALVVSGSVLANDADVDGGPSPLSVSAFDATTAAGGSVSMSPNGTFNYLPPTGFVGSDSFTYTITDGQSTDQGTVAVQVADVVWYVNGAAAGAQTGRSTEPFATLGQAESAASATHIIHVAPGLYATGIVLLDGQQLIGSGVPLVVGAHILAPATSRPNVSGTIQLASGTAVSGLNVVGVSPIGIGATSVTSGSIYEVGISSFGDGISLADVSGAFTVTNAAINPGGRGLVLSGAADVTMTTSSIVTSGSTGVVASGSGLLAFNGGSIASTSAIAMNVTGRQFGGSGLTSVTSSGGASGIVVNGTSGVLKVNGTGIAGSGGTINSASGPGIQAVNAEGVKLGWMTVTGSGAQGLLVSNTLAGPSSIEVRNTTMTSNFSAAIQAANSGTGSMAITVDANAMHQNGGAVVLQTSNGPLDAIVTGNSTTFNSGNAISIARNAGASGAVNATVTGNVIGTAGVLASGTNCGGGCIGISISARGSNTFRTRIENNQIRQVDAFGIRLLAGQGTASLSATVMNNDVGEPLATALAGISIQSGIVTADTSSVCAAIEDNVVTGAWTPGIAVRNFSSGSQFSLPGYLGLGTDTTAVAAFISGNNTVASVTATRRTIAPANQFSGGGPCPLPAP
jgi:VCBS repeat-containing protein